MNITENAAKELYKIAEKAGVINTLHTVFGRYISVSIPMSKAICAIDIDELEFSKRASNALKRSALKTVGEVADYIAEGRLASIRNLGSKSASEIKTRILLLAYSDLTEYEKLSFWEDVLERNCE